MDRRSQGAVEYILLLAAVLVIVGSIVFTIYVASSGLGSSVRSEIDNVRDNIVVPGLVGMILG